MLVINICHTEVCLICFDIWLKLGIIDIQQSRSCSTASLDVYDIYLFPLLYLNWKYKIVLTHLLICTKLCKCILKFLWIGVE